MAKCTGFREAHLAEWVRLGWKVVLVSLASLGLKVIRVRQALKEDKEKRGRGDLLDRQVYQPSTCGGTLLRNGLHSSKPVSTSCLLQVGLVEKAPQDHLEKWAGLADRGHLVNLGSEEDQGCQERWGIMVLVALQDDLGLQGEMGTMGKMVSRGHLVFLDHRARGDTGGSEDLKGKKVMRVLLASEVQEVKLVNLARRVELVYLVHKALLDPAGLRESEVALGQRDPLGLMGRVDWMAFQVCQGHRVHQVPQDELAHKELMAQGGTLDLLAVMALKAHRGLQVSRDRLDLRDSEDRKGI